MGESASSVPSKRAQGLRARIPRRLEEGDGARSESLVWVLGVSTCLEVVSHDDVREHELAPFNSCKSATAAESSTESSSSLCLFTEPSFSEAKLLKDVLVTILTRLQNCDLAIEGEQTRGDPSDQPQNEEVGFLKTSKEAGGTKGAE